MDQKDIQERRADNQVWNGAGRYDLRPEFHVFDRAGQADLYFNTVVGLVHRLYDYDKLRPLLDSFQGRPGGELYCDLFWLGLEGLVYARARTDRPALDSLRRAYARRVVDQARARADRDVWESLKVAWFRRALGERREESPWEKGVLDELTFPPDLDEAAIRARMEDLLYHWFRRARRSALDELGASRVDRGFFSTWHIGHTRGDSLRRLGRPGDGPEGGGRFFWQKKHLSVFWQTKTREKILREYIEACFGQSMLPAPEALAAERELCTGDHRNCRLHFTRGDLPEAGGRGEAARERALFQAQRQRNRAYYEKDRPRHQLAIAQLTQRLQNTLLLQRDVTDVPARAGRLSPGLAWRSATLGDERVFLQRRESQPGELTVDLLLDGSASQNRRQEQLAAQAYLIASALTRCQIPVRVSAFCSVSGCTVLRVFRDYAETDRNDRIFDYVAAGWNRDGLALRAMGWLMARNRGDRRLLIILSDANPNDDQKIPSNSLLHGNRDYSGPLGIKDTAEEAALLRRRGITLLCVYTGGDRELEGARKIYGRDVIRLPSIAWFADTVGRLIQDHIRELQA